MSKTLLEHRVERLLTLRALASEAGCSAKTLQAIENGRRKPHFETVEKVSRALAVQPCEVAEFAATLNDRARVHDGEAA